MQMGGVNPLILWQNQGVHTPLATPGTVGRQTLPRMGMHDSLVPAARGTGRDRSSDRFALSLRLFLTIRWRHRLGVAVHCFQRLLRQFGDVFIPRIQAHANGVQAAPRENRWGLGPQ